MATTQDFLGRTMTDTGSQGAATQSRMYPGLFNDLEKAREVLLSQYYHDYEFVMKIPDLPDSFFLYVDPSIREAFELRKDEPTKEDLAAMSAGLLDRINLDYHMIHPEDAQLMNDHVKETTKKYQEEREQLRKKGLNFVPLENPLEKNPELDQKDLDLCTIDLEDNPMNQKDLPTLSLLKRPLYTELGQQTKEARTTARIARIVNQNSQHPTLMLSQAQLLDQQEIADEQTPARSTRQSGAGIPGAAKGPPRSDDEWREQVAVSFKRAKALDVNYRNFVLALAQEKLGLDGKKNPDEIFALTRRLVQLLAVPGSLDSIVGAVLPKEMVNQLWSDVCLAVVDENPKEAGFKAVSTRILASTAGVAADVAAAVDAYGEEWQQWWSEYGNITKGTTRAQRAALLKGSSVSGAGEFKPGISDPAALNLRHPTKKNVVPMVVKPLLPGHCTELESNGYGGETNEYSHLVFSNTRPHHSREDKKLKEVPAVSTADGTRVYRPITGSEAGAEGPIEVGSTSLYFTHEEEFVSGRPLQQAQCSYVLQVFDSRVEYSRVGTRLIHEHKMLKPGTSEALKKNVVVVWEDEENEDAPPKKRQRLEAAEH